MTSRRHFFAVDSHTMGEPTRIILDGFPSVDGSTMMKKKQYLQRHYDDLRRALMNEPRGHRDMFGALILAPVNPAADIGVVFMDGGGYLNMCGHGSIGVATVAVDRRLVRVKEPVTEVVLDTPAGLVRAAVAVSQGKVRQVSIVNVPAFLYRRDVSICVPELGAVKLDIAFGGNFFALVDAETLGLALRRDERSRLIALGTKIRRAVNEQQRVEHPLLTDVRSVDLVEFYGPALTDGGAMRNVVVFGGDQIDRSPCGTGTSAKLAALHARGQLRCGESFTYESLLGTHFRGRIIAETRVGSYPAIIPEITGQAFVTAENTLIIDESDPLKYGFLL
ncbi:MAG: proline racemase family protein [Sporolactobacillus sp.]